MMCTPFLNRVPVSYLILIGLMVLLSVHASAQEASSKTDDQLNKAVLEFTAQLQKEKEELSPADRFAVDTFRIEKQLKLSIEADYSRNGMMLATYKALDGYDDLLNQYYQALINQLTPEDQSILKKAQRHWLAYRDAEIELNRITTEDQYTGGGSIHLLVKAHRNLEITKQRVIELQAYLMRTI